MLVDPTCRLGSSETVGSCGAVPPYAFLVVILLMLFLVPAVFANDLSRQPELEPTDANLADAAQAIASEYRSHALGFVCREEIRAIKYLPAGGPSRVKARTNDYSLVYTEESAAFEAIRTPISGGRLPKWARSISTPEAYTWAFLLQGVGPDARNISMAQTVSESGHMVHRITWQNSAAVNKGRRLDEWSGEMTIDKQTLVPVRLTAIPTFQNKRIRIKRKQRAESWRIALFGFSFRTKPPAREHELEVRWLHKHDGLAYPWLVVQKTFRRIGPRKTDRWLEREVRREYKDYRFFSTEAKEKRGSVEVVPDNPTDDSHE